MVIQLTFGRPLGVAPFVAAVMLCSTSTMAQQKCGYYCSGGPLLDDPELDEVRPQPPLLLLGEALHIAVGSDFAGHELDMRLQQVTSFSTAAHGRTARAPGVCIASLPAKRASNRAP